MMSARIDAAQARSWLDAIPGAELGEQSEQLWQRFAANDRPVVTVYGAYDTGKSSLLRRLIVDAGAQVPEWLTISARHETFEVNEVEAAGCIMRDTPGFVAGAADARADMNTQLANDAVDLTDVAIITVTPQLATAEYPALQDLLQRQWIRGSLWFVISRFDEAGVDPESDVDGYGELAQRKTDELRRALALDEIVPVFVVSQDFAQMAGADRNPAAEIWDEFREWDGMAELRAAIAELGSGSRQALRDAAAQRFWRQNISTALDAIRSEAEKYKGHQSFSDEGLRQRESWLSQVDALHRSAEADLKSRINDAVTAALDDQKNPEAFKESLTKVVDLWYSVQERSIEKLRQNVDATTKVERQRPSWRELEDLVDTIRVESDRQTSQESQSEIYATGVKRVSKAALLALVEYERSASLKKSTAVVGSASKALSSRAAVATAVVPVIEELTSVAQLIWREKADSAERDKRRQELAAELDRFGERATLIAMDEFEPIVAAARDAIIDATAEQVEIWNSLTKLVGELETLIASGERLSDGPLP